MMELNQEKLELKLKINQRVMGFHPSAPVTFKQAVLLALNGKHEEAIKQAENAALAYPNELERFANSLRLLKIEYPEFIEPLEDWANRKIKEKLYLKKRSCLFWRNIIFNQIKPPLTYLSAGAVYILT